MNTEQISKIKTSIDNLKEKKSRIYFLVQDTKGNAKASMAYIYRLALTLKNNGYNAIILHEKVDYTGVSTWLGEEYMENLQHKPIEGENLEVSPEDLIIIPELFGFVMSQLTKMPCGKIVLCQAYDHILETLQPGATWTQLGFLKCIITSDYQKDLVEGLMRNISFQILPPNPIIAIHSREQRESINIIKSFYIKYPQYRWVTFRDMRGLSEQEFASVLKDSFLSVWIDETSSYGTFPLESMKVGVPVIGLTPNLVPTWMNENNGVWVNNKIQILDFIADFLQNWLEDNVKQDLYTEMIKTVENLPSKTDFETKTVELFSGYINTRATSFEEQLSKLETTE